MLGGYRPIRRVCVSEVADTAHSHRLMNFPVSVLAFARIITSGYRSKGRKGTGTCAAVNTSGAELAENTKA